MSEQKTIADLIVVWRDGGEALITTRKYPDSTERAGKVAWPVGIAGYYLAGSHVRPATFHPSSLAVLAAISTGTDGMDTSGCDHEVKLDGEDGPIKCMHCEAPMEVVHAGEQQATRLELQRLREKTKPPALFWSVRYKPGPPEALRIFPDEPAAQAWIVQGFKKESLTGSREDWEVFPIYRGSLAEVSPYQATQDGPEAVARAKGMNICEIIEDPYFTTTFKANQIAERFGAVAMGANL